MERYLDLLKPLLNDSNHDVRLQAITSLGHLRISQIGDEKLKDILLAQIEKYDELENNVDFLAEFSQRGGKFVDMAGFIRYNAEDKEALSFGKYRDVTLEQIWKDNPGYFSWINQADFPLYTKNVMKNFAAKMKLQNKFSS